MVEQHYRWDFVGLSTDTKPTPTTSEKVVDGSTFYCSDTSKLYVFCKDDWYERKPLGGGGGGDINVVQTTGTSTTDVMSQNATTSMIFANPGINSQIRIGSTGTVSNYAIRIGHAGNATNNSAISIGHQAQVAGQNSVALGPDTLANHRGSVALGASAQTTVKGQIMVGTANTYDGYNSTNYRIISGVHDAQSTNDAVTLGQLNGRVLQNAGAPTTATVGTVGQLLEDTTNGKLYQCTAINNTDPNNPSYTWSEVGAGGGGPTVVQTTGQSTTDVMSQKAVTDIIGNVEVALNTINNGTGD
ncbi:MAG: hypothetical protein J6S67_11670 [Methanobrevibacter sp.]|nr:hypothetical protein [Methanobrevibacter sp.]